MAKKINKRKLLWRGRSIFLSEYLRVLNLKGMVGIRQYLKMLNFAVENERLVEHAQKAVVQLFIPPIPSRAFARYLRSYTDSLILGQETLHLGTVLISITDACPYDCWYCSARGFPQGQLSEDSLEKVLNTLRSWGASIIGFTGGEPLLRNDIDDLIQRYSEEFTFMFFTSGYGLDRQRAQTFSRKGLYGIVVSLDDHDRVRHDRARGRRGAFKTACDAIKHAKEAGLYTAVQSVITRGLLEDGRMWNFLSFVQQTGADELLLLEPLGTGNLLHGDGHAFLNPHEREKLRWFHHAALSHETLPKITSFADFEDRSRYGCGAGIQHAYVDGHGNLWPCNFLPISLGNIIDQPHLVRERLSKYFGHAHSACILTSKRHQIQKLARQGIPIPFARVKKILNSHRQVSENGARPAFYTTLTSGNGYDDHK